MEHGARSMEHEAWSMEHGACHPVEVSFTFSFSLIRLMLFHYQL